MKPGCDRALWTLRARQQAVLCLRRESSSTDTNESGSLCTGVL